VARLVGAVTFLVQLFVVNFTEIDCMSNASLH